MSQGRGVHFDTETCQKKEIQEKEAFVLLKIDQKEIRMEEGQKKGRSMDPASGEDPRGPKGKTSLWKTYKIFGFHMFACSTKVDL